MKTALIVLALLFATPAMAEWLPYPGYSPTECTWEGETVYIGPAPIDCGTMSPELQALIEARGNLACTAPEDWEEAVGVFTDEVYTWFDCYFSNLNSWIRQILEMRSRRR
jgi:hypothetical protein